VAINDTLSDDLPNTFSLIDDTDFGSLNLLADGSFQYQPGTDYVGDDEFVYEVCDATPDCDMATVSITVLSADEQPDAQDDSFTFPPEQASSDSIANNDVLSGDGGNVWSLDTPPASGLLQFDPNGDFTYTPAEGFSGMVSFEYSLCDIDSDCDSATAQIEVLPISIFGDGFETGN
jgi:hypothetical protein